MMNKIQYRAVPFLDVFGRANWARPMEKFNGYLALIPTSGELNDPFVRKVRLANLRRVLECAGVSEDANYLPTTMRIVATETIRREMRTGSGVKDVRCEHRKPREYIINIQSLIDKGIAFAISEAKATRFNKVLEENDELRATIHKLRKENRRRRACK